MKGKLKDVQGKKFIAIPVIPVEQKGNLFYLGSIQAKDFDFLYTVEPTQYDVEREIANAVKIGDDDSYLAFLRTKSHESDGFQRNADSVRVKQIKQFLCDEKYAFFPNTIIATCDLLEEANDQLRDEHFLEAFSENSAILSSDRILYVPYKPNVILIIDGQHRLEGIRGVFEEKSRACEDYDLIISFMLNLDRATIAQLFYTINYTQKSVNKSLLYHLTGEFSGGIDRTTFLHETVKLMNELDVSPFYRRVKMLGIVPLGTDDKAKAALTISQAFLIDALDGTISDTKLASLYAPIFLAYYKDKRKHIEIIRFILRYFEAVRDIRRDWDTPDTSMISKTVGIGALIKTMHYIFVKMFLVEWKSNPDKILTISKEELKSKLDGLDKVNFSTGGPYGKVASGGTVNKLTEEIISSLTYFKNESSVDFKVYYKEHYKSLFTAWLKQYASPVN